MSDDAAEARFAEARRCPAFRWLCFELRSETQPSCTCTDQRHEGH